MNIATIDFYPLAVTITAFSTINALWSQFWGVYILLGALILITQGLLFAQGRGWTKEELLAEQERLNSHQIFREREFEVAEIFRAWAQSNGYGIHSPVINTGFGIFRVEASSPKSLQLFSLYYANGEILIPWSEVENLRPS